MERGIKYVLIFLCVVNSRWSTVHRKIKNLTLTPYPHAAVDCGHWTVDLKQLINKKTAAPFVK
jgi:hypothetical protein